ncbi:MAG: ATPase, partial [Parabacteroides sp.]|nr:ATPase [Parabacteroides sp.]
MIAIADSGSTKTEWCLVEKIGQIHSRCFTPGMNPYFQSEEQMTAMIQQVLYPQWTGLVIDAVYFYG